MSRTKNDAVFKALADPTRRKILDLLRRKAKTTGDLCAAFPNLDRCTVMLHVGVLERAKLIVPRREGRFRWNELNKKPIQRAHQAWLARFLDEDF